MERTFKVCPRKLLTSHKPNLESPESLIRCSVAEKGFELASYVVEKVPLRQALIVQEIFIPAGKDDVIQAIFDYVLGVTVSIHDVPEEIE